MLHKILASIGVGSATVDTILHNSVTEPGGHLGGYVRVRGGAVEQTIDHVKMQLLTKVAVESGDRETHRTRTRLPSSPYPIACRSHQARNETCPS